MKKVLVAAPHPDDETMGCGGTILKHKANGDLVYWLIITSYHEDKGFSSAVISERKSEIQKVAESYPFDEVFQLNLPTTYLDAIPMSEMIGKVSRICREFAPEVVYLPYPGDVHSDHRVVFDIVSACTKWFRYESVKRVLAYEALSETEFGINPDINAFRPNVFVDIAEYLERKIDIMKIYNSEVGSFPYPRSEEAIRALAALRGATSGNNAAEAFMLLRERS